MNNRSHTGRGRQSYADLPPRFETEADVNFRLGEIIGLLSLDEAMEAVTSIEVLNFCHRNGVRCNWAACPKCMRAFRLRLHHQARAILPKKAEILFLTLVPESYRVEIGELSQRDLITWAKHRQRGIQRALPKGAMFLGGVDFSLNNNHDDDPHWCFHIHGFIILPEGWGTDSRYKRRKLRKGIARHCPPATDPQGGRKQRPLMLQKWPRKDFRENLLYAYKSMFYSRERLLVVGADGNANPSRFKFDLPAQQKSEISLYLCDYKVGARLILVGMRRQGQDANFTLIRHPGRQSSGSRGDLA